MKANSNLTAAKSAKNDEFYTKLTDIENEVFRYKDQFKGKTVLCNCDDPEKSNFFKYFALNFEFFGLKKLITTHYDLENGAYKLEISKDVNNDGEVDMDDAIKTPLKGFGDFRSEECVEVLKEADIVVTNPPFSLFREFIALMVEHDKKFLIIGNKNAITYKETFKLIKENKLWLGYLSPKEFIQPDKSMKKFGNIGWFTNLDTQKRHEDIILYREYNETDYPKYDNYDAINVDKVKDIPKDYFEPMGVPITFLDKFNPEQFEILGCMEPALSITKLQNKPNFKEFKSRQVTINGIKCQKTYHRLIIKRK